MIEDETRACGGLLAPPPGSIGHADADESSSTRTDSTLGGFAMTATMHEQAVLTCDGWCDGWCDGANPVAMIGNKGYTYCAPCGVQRRESGYENVRKLRPHELATLRRGEPLRRY